MTPPAASSADGRSPRAAVARPSHAQVILASGMSFAVRSSLSERVDAPTFVLVHGIGASTRYLRRLHDRLSSTGSVHSIDLPGFGGMRKPDRSADIETMARSLGRVLSQVGVESAVLVGHSMGAQWVVELAAQQPTLVDAVVLIGPVTDDAHRSVPAQALALMLDVAGETPAANYAVFSAYVRCGPRYYLRQLPHMIAYPIEERVGELSMPVVVIRGGDDPVAGLSWCRRLRDAASAGSLVVVPGHRHVVQFSAPAAVASAIVAHLPVRSVAAPA